MIPIGTKVLVMSNKGKANTKHKMDGHICTIKKVVYKQTIDEVFEKTYPYYYKLHWKQQDNPRRTYPSYEIDFYWFDDDLRLYIPQTVAVAAGLPDF